ncbi:efflux RND transporter periplasmic adaptor subunit [Geomonas subterranea]|uniref:efflux RND transporter periplasmic adaptor subunit n=1 Tax=Geomonas subterranea TaxID=2847989 RepID=UPI001CD58CDA|nr:efflux RND transporter periplasmic adaptor subunit [Geomonas fuzhouensis]
MNRKLIAMTVISITALAAFAGLGARYLSAKEEPAYITATAGKSDIEEKVLASGILTAQKTVEVGAQVSGQLKKLHVAAGDVVRKGQLLAEIDPVLQANALKDAQATLDNVRAQRNAKDALLRQYTLAYRRQKELAALDATSRADLESAQAQVETTRAELAALDAQISKSTIAVDTAGANLGYTRIVAPMDGVVLSIITEEGQTVVSTQAATTILTLANLDTMTVKAKISEADVMRIKPGLPVYFSLLGDAEKRYTGRLRAIEPAAVSTGTTSSASTGNSGGSTAIYYYGLFEVPNLDHRLRNSMTAQVSVVIASVKNALCIPLASVENRGGNGGGTVKVLREGRPETRKLRLGLSDNVAVQVLEGVKEGERVVIGDSSTVPKAQGGAMSPPPRR